jgi:hypothetical protein
MQRHAILELMAKLKLRGMRAAYDEVMTLAAKRQHAPERVVAELDLPPWSGGVGSERHAASSMVIPSMLARASAGVR